MPTLSELQIQRGRLLERIAYQRANVRKSAEPLQKALNTTDRAIAVARSAAAYLKQRPWILGAGVAVVFALKGRRVFRLMKHGFILWRTWRSLRNSLSSGMSGFTLFGL